ncbi:MAG TPA: DUF456 domain-containing protein [Acidimicrobiia bacterium]|jgi:uncharacterized protein YqgC (DUF456 family)
MDELGELVVALAIVAGLLGIVLPILPGLLLVVGAIFVWALVDGGGLAWSVAVGSLGLSVVGTFVKYSIPRRRLNESGVLTRTLILATAVAIVGLFVVPVIGAPIGFVGTVYLTERMKGDRDLAWPRTKKAMAAVATSIGIELATGLIIAALWFGVILFT